MPKQLKLDFSIKPILDGKKNERLSIPCSSEFIKFLDLLSSMYGKTRAELGHRFILEGMQQALGNAFMSEPYLDKKLSDLMGK